MMPQEEPKNCDPETDNTDEDSDAQTTTYAEEIVPDGGEPSPPGEMQTATERAAANETPLPTTPIGCSTSLGPRQVQSIPDRDTTPIRATTTFDQEATKDKEKDKSKPTGPTEKK